jgi:hypothetical protein
LIAFGAVIAVAQVVTKALADLLPAFTGVLPEEIAKGTISPVFLGLLALFQAARRTWFGHGNDQKRPVRWGERALLLLLATVLGLSAWRNAYSAQVKKQEEQLGVWSSLAKNGACPRDERAVDLALTLPIGVDSGTLTLCPADPRDEVRAFAENSGGLDQLGSLEMHRRCKMIKVNSSTRNWRGKVCMRLSEDRAQQAPLLEIAGTMGDQKARVYASEEPE